MTGPIPDPPVFTSKSVKFTVPPYFAFEHAESQWLINMIRSNSWDRIWRVAISNPNYFTQTYIQFPDCPDTGMGDPMFHKRSVLYLTALGLAIYMNRHVLVRKILEFKTDENEALVDPNQQLYATNVYERNPICSDLHVIFPFCVLFRRESFECTKYLLRAGWNAHAGFLLPYRRAYRMFSFEYKDFLDYCIAQMAVKANLRLTNLIFSMTNSMSQNFSLLEFENVECDYRGSPFVDWISLPRRMLRFLFYFDKDLRLACQIIRCVNVVQKALFFAGPCKSAFDINYSDRNLLTALNSDRKTKVLFDQDCCISLLLGIFYRAVSLRHNQTQEKLLEVLISILVHTHWVLHFLITPPTLLVDHFGNLIENVKPLKIYTIEITKKNIHHKLRNNYFHRNDLPELNLKTTTKTDWEDALNEFFVLHRDKLGIAERVNKNKSFEDNENNVFTVPHKTCNLVEETPYIII